MFWNVPFNGCLHSVSELSILQPVKSLSTVKKHFATNTTPTGQYLYAGQAAIIQGQGVLTLEKGGMSAV